MPARLPARHWWWLALLLCVGSVAANLPAIRPVTVGEHPRRRGVNF